MAKKFPLLNSPFQVGDIELKNRIIMGSMHTGLEEEDDGYEKMARFYEARAGVGLIVTGGIAPNRSGWIAPFSSKLTSKREANKHRLITEAVHRKGGKIALQILHSGRYGYHPLILAPSRLKAPISPFTPLPMPDILVKSTIDDYVRCAALAQDAGYDGIEIMGSEGYLINQFISKATNQRKDRWGGVFANRIRFPLEIVRKTREKVGKDFIIIFRLSMLDLIKDGSSWEEVLILAKALERAGVTILNTGIGWHEARIPTIATMVPRKAFSWVTEKIRPHLSVPVITTNRINTPEVAESILAGGQADLVSMARPLLADQNFAEKAAAGKADEINTCIACNQACLDHIFKKKTATCLVNPSACREKEFAITRTTEPKKVAIIGAGPAGLSCALEAAKQGHEPVVFEAGDSIGGQFNIAKEIPGKEEFHETLRYFKVQFKKWNIATHLNKTASLEDILGGGFDAVVLATGVRGRTPEIEGVDHPSVLSYREVLLEKRPVGKKVIIIGAGGIGYDTAEFLAHSPSETHTQDVAAFCKRWGIDQSLEHPGGLLPGPADIPLTRDIVMMQRSDGKPGAKLGKTTGWIHRKALKQKGVKILTGVTYNKIDDQGLHIRVNGDRKVYNADNIILCAGQTSNIDLLDELKSTELPVHVIGGAKKAEEIDAQRAIREGAVVARDL